MSQSTGAGLTGTRITSSKPVAVISGSQATSISGSTNTDMVVEQMIPVTQSNGLNFVINPNLASPDYFEIVFLVPLTEGTTVRYNYAGSWNFWSIGPTSTFDRQSLTLSLPLVGTRIVIGASGPTICVRVIEKQRTGDTMMVTALPVTQWDTGYNIFVHGSQISMLQLNLAMTVNSTILLFQDQIEFQASPCSIHEKKAEFRQKKKKKKKKKI